MSYLHTCAFDHVIQDKSYNSQITIDILKECIGAGVDINRNDSDILRRAIFKNDIIIVGFLIDNGIKITDEALECAVTMGPIMTKLLLDTNININLNDSSLLIEAIREEDLDTLQLLIDYGINISADNDNALIEASTGYNLEILKLLLSLGADVNAQKSEIATRDIMVLDNIKLLIEYGLNYRAHNDSLLRSAVKNNKSKDITMYLLNLIKPDCLEKETLDQLICSTFIHQADLEIKKLLLDRGANPNAIITKSTYDDVSILEYATINGEFACCKLLLEYGADVNLCKNIIDGKRREPIKKKGKSIDDYTKIIELFNDHGLDITTYMIWVMCRI
jgi:hypothetical protein